MSRETGSGPGDVFPATPIRRLAAPIERFLHVEAASGGVLVAATAAALVLANSRWAGGFLGFWSTPVELGFGDVQLSHSLRHWINDGLMVLFFFVVGLEVKRELVLGELRELRKAALPLAAALGGMAVPAGLYLALQAGQPAARGWGIPMATDIAFVVGCMAVLGARVPHGMRVWLLSLAIADDVGAILVIAVGYTETLHLTALGLGAAGLVAVNVLERLGVRSFGVYTVLGVAVWLCFHESGVHATIAGVILGLMTPARAHLSGTRVGRLVEQAGRYAAGSGAPAAAGVREVQRATRELVSPLAYLENALHPWTSFVVIPLFAFANAGVPLSAGSLGDPVVPAVVLGLVVGKPVGIAGFSWLAVRLGLADLPAGLGWKGVLGGGCLAGIGFTMSIFIAGLALEGAALDAAKAGILAASALAAVLGMGILVATHPRSGTRRGEA